MNELYYVITSIIYLLSEIIDDKYIQIIYKPLLMLILYDDAPNMYIKFGVIFGLLGDITLLLKEYNDIYFITGIVFFLILQLFYIIHHLKYKNGIKNRYSIILIILLGILYYIFVVKDIDTIILISITIYMILLLTMLYIAMIYQNKRIILGSILFVLSDSLIVIDKYRYHWEYNGVIIMLLYIIGQYYIVKNR